MTGERPAAGPRRCSACWHAGIIELCGVHCSSARADAPINCDVPHPPLARDVRCCACTQALTPQLTENRRKAEELLREAYVLSDCLQRRCKAAVLEKLLPKRWKQYTKGISGKA